jgi:hypothetical protein
MRIIEETKSEMIDIIAGNAILNQVNLIETD